MLISIYKVQLKSNNQSILRVLNNLGHIEPLFNDC